MTKRHVLIAILAVAAILRLVNLGGGDVLGDEALYAFRAIGMVDFDEAEFQTTPWEWFDPDIPFWAKLSFHDHPPLVFLTQNIFMSVFGVNNFGFRLPSALLGIAAVYLLYLIGRRLYSEKTGLLAAALAAVTANQVFISRVGLQEAYVIFFILLTLYFYLKFLGPVHQGAIRPYSAQGSGKYLVLAGTALGLGMLAKYTVFAAAVIIFFHILIFRRDILRQRHFWCGALAALLIFSPVIIYNLGLYLSAGHFDFQLSYIFGQDPEIWKAAPGKEEIGNLADRLENFIPNLIATYSPLFLILFGLSIPFLRKNKFLFISLPWLVALLLVIGPTTRFLTMLAPFMALSIAVAAIPVHSHVLKNVRMTKIAVMAVAVLAAFEIFYSLNTQVFVYPVGPAQWLYSAKLRAINYNWGFNELDGYLKRELENRMPAVAFEPKYQFLNDIQTKWLTEAETRGFSPRPLLILYDGNIFNISQLWVLDRWSVYRGWPIIKAEDYFKIFAEQRSDFFRENGIGEFHYIAIAEKIPTKKSESLTDAGVRLEQALIAGGVRPEIIQNKKGEEAFRIYKF